MSTNPSKVKKTAKGKVAKKEKYLLHITASGLKRIPYAGQQEDDLKTLVGDLSGNCTVGVTANYLTNRDCSIAHDDQFLDKEFPLTAIINGHFFHGALVIFCQRDIEPYDIEGLAEKECKQVESEISVPKIFPFSETD